MPLAARPSKQRADQGTENEGDETDQCGGRKAHHEGTGAEAPQHRETGAHSHCGQCRPEREGGDPLSEEPTPFSPSRLGEDAERQPASLESDITRRAEKGEGQEAKNEDREKARERSLLASAPGPLPRMKPCEQRANFG